MLRPVISVILGLAVILSLPGCVSLLPKTTPSQLYRFGADTSAAGDRAPTSDAGKIGVVMGSIGFPRASTSDGILTVTGDQTAYIDGVRWVAPARLLFQEAMQRAFERRSKRVQLVNVGDVGPAGGLLRVEVTTFEARYAQPGRSPTIVVSLSARLARSDGRLLDQRDFTASNPADANTVAAIVQAFDRTVDQVLTEVTDWTDAQVAALPNTPPPNDVTSTSSTTTTTTVKQR